MSFVFCPLYSDLYTLSFTLHCVQHSLEDEQLIEACLNAGPPDGHMVIFDARSIVAAAGNMLKVRLSK